ncbi:MAG: hypothetical protein V3U27_17360, partial [Candidatus Tectomicrobia bacterium]
MGIGHGLMEDMVMQDGHPHALSFADYLIPTSGDMPELQSIILESGSGKGPFGAKGIGEPALIPVVPAIVNGELRQPLPLSRPRRLLSRAPKRLALPLHMADDVIGRRVLNALDCRHDRMAV